MQYHDNDVIMGTIASQITSLTIVYSTVYSDADQRKHQSYVLLAFVRGIHRGPVNSPHKWQVTRKMFQFDDVIRCWSLFMMMAWCGTPLLNRRSRCRWFETPWFYFSKHLYEFMWCWHVLKVISYVMQSVHRQYSTLDRALKKYHSYAASSFQMSDY